MKVCREPPTIVQAGRRMIGAVFPQKERRPRCWNTENGKEAKAPKVKRIEKPRFPFNVHDLEVFVN